MLMGMAKPLAKLISMLTPKRRWAQFSLATMLVVVTVLCVGLRLIVVPAERQRRAVAAIKALGGSVYYVEPNQQQSDQQASDEEASDEEASDDEASDDEASDEESILRRWLPRDYFDEVRLVDLRGSHFKDADLTQLQRLPGLQGLYLDAQPPFTDAGMAQLQRLPWLQELSLYNTQVTDAGLAHLQGLTGLQVLILNATQVTDAGLAHLHGLMELQTLDLGSTQVTDAGLAHLHGLMGLQQLSCMNTKVTGAGLAKLRQALPKCQITHW
jgi:hypothetical protein